MLFLLEISPGAVLRGLQGVRPQRDAPSSMLFADFRHSHMPREWQGGTIIALPKWDSSPNPTPPSLPWLQPPPWAAKLPMHAGQGRFSSCTAAAPAQWHSSALPWLTETPGAAASINGALCSLRSQMPSPSPPHAERVLCVHNQPLGRSELGNKTPSLSPGRDWCPPGRGEGWGQQVQGGV